MKGVLGGILTSLFVMSVLYILGTVTVTGYPNRMLFTNLIYSIVGILMWTIFLGITEEVIFRGMVVREIAIKHGWLKSSLYGGIYFGLVNLIEG